MCSIPPKFYQICRLCLSVVSDSDSKNFSIFLNEIKNFNNKNDDRDDDNLCRRSVGGGGVKEEPEDDENDVKNYHNKKIKCESIEDDQEKDDDDDDVDKDLSNVKNLKSASIGDDNDGRLTKLDTDFSSLYGSSGSNNDNRDDSLVDIPQRIYTCLSITVSFFFKFLSLFLVGHI